MKITKKGAIPIPYIIALILGIVVLAIVAYWLFFSSGQFGGTISEASCRAKKMAYCNAWRINGWAEKPNGVDDFSTACNGIDEDNRDKYYAPECCRFEWAHSMTLEKCQS